MSFPALPNSFKRGGESEKWTAQRGGLGQADFAAKLVSAPTDLSPASRFRRTVANATVAIGHESISQFASDSSIPTDVVAATDAARINGYIDAIDTVARYGYYDDYDERFDGSTVTQASESVDFTPPHSIPKGSFQMLEQTDDIVGAYQLFATKCAGGNPLDTTEFRNYLASPIPPDEEDTTRRKRYRAALTSAAYAARATLTNDEPTEAWLDAQTDESITETVAKRVWAALSEYLDADTSRSEESEFPTAIEYPSSAEADEATEWCNMTIVRPKLHLPMKSTTKRASWRISDEGSFIKRPDRAFTDGRVFGNRRRRPNGGAVLIDCSGSMHLAETDIDFIMQNSPGVTVATYCSSTYDGYLYIVAEKGRRADNDHIQYSGMCNGCDGPALRWLAKQPGPRTWICDGIVTGVHDAPAYHLSAECEEIVSKNKIRQIQSMDEFRALATASSR